MVSKFVAAQQIVEILLTLMREYLSASTILTFEMVFDNFFRLEHVFLRNGGCAGIFFS
jgi:hypothetical protein